MRWSSDVTTNNGNLPSRLLVFTIFFFFVKQTNKNIPNYVFSCLSPSNFSCDLIMFRNKVYSDWHNKLLIL